MLAPSPFGAEGFATQRQAKLDERMLEESVMLHATLLNVSGLSRAGW